MSKMRTTTLRRGTAFLAVATLASVGLVAAGVPANAAMKLPGSNFEIDSDANLVVDAGSPSIDWLNDAGTAMRTGVVSRPDLASGGGDDSFGNGTKEDTAVPSVTDGSIPPNKSDLKNFGVFKEGSFLHLFWSRVQDPSGSTNMDFEFNQLNTLSSNGVTPVRSAGDLLIQYDLGNGGTVATLSKRTWSGSAWSDPAVPLAGNAIGSINTSAIAASASGGLGSLSPRTFGEASINLTSIFPAGSCTNFGFAYLKSRSSDQFNSAIKDFIAPEAVNLTNCGSLIVRKNDGAGNRLGGAGFTVSKTNFTSTTMPQPATGLFCLDGVLAGTYTVTESTVPPGYTGAGPQNFTVTTGTTCAGRLGSPVNTSVTPDLTFTNNLTPGTVNIAKTDDAGNALPGATFTLYVDAATVGSYDAADTVVAAGPTQTNGSGTIQWTSIAPGNYCAVETGTPTGYDTAAAQCFTLGAGTTAGTGATVNRTFTDDRQHRIIVLVCHEATDTLTSSSVTLSGAGGSTKSSLAPGSLSAAQQKALCDTGGASFGNLSGHGARTLTVTPPTH